MSDPVRPRLKAFVGRSFHGSDEPLWQEVRGVLDALLPLGFVYEDAKGAQPRPVSEKVQEAIKGNDIYIGILSRRAPLIESDRLRARLTAINKWATSSWVVQESGYALGLDRPVLLLIEEGVDFPTAHLDADTEWISFRRGSVAQIGTRLTQMIGHLIARRLPPVAASVSEPVVVDATSPPEDKPAAPPEPGFDDALRLLSEGRIAEADQAFQQWADASPRDDFTTWFECFYLYNKAVKGDSGALDDLRRRIEQNPDHLDARFELVRYYNHFKNFEESARILKEGLETRQKGHRLKLLRRLATVLARDGKTAEAIDVAGRSCVEAVGDDKYLSYDALADVAKTLEMFELEATALEAALVLRPNDKDLRFRLAYLYGRIGKRRLALFHYKLRLAQGHDPTSLNNLGVSYAELKLTSLEVDAFQRAELGSAIARANLAHAYIDRGFLARGEELASSVLAASSEDYERVRATAALQRVSGAKRSEKESEEKISDAAQAASAFRSRYAPAYVESGPVIPLEGVFGTPHGKIPLVQSDNRVSGTTSVLVEKSQSLVAALASPGAPPKQRERKVQYEIILTGRAGALTVTITESDVEPSFLAMPQTTVFKGLAVVAADGRSFEGLEETEGDARIYTARKVSG